MFKTIKKHWRKSSNFNSAFIASMIVSFFFGKYISLLLEQDSLPTWNNNLPYIIVLTIVVILLYIVFYKFYINQCDDLKNKQNFYDNFFVSLVVVIVSTFMVLYNLYLPDYIFWLLSLIIILIIYFPLNWLFIKSRPQ
jgi:hypothetical protein